MCRDIDTGIIFLIINTGYTPWHYHAQRDLLEPFQPTTTARVFTCIYPRSHCLQPTSRNKTTSDKSQISPPPPVVIMANN